MGEAKNRGTREDRVQQARERVRAEHDARRKQDEERRAAEQAAFDALPPEEQEKAAEQRRWNRMPMAGMISIAAILAAGMHGPRGRRGW